MRPDMTTNERIFFEREAAQFLTEELRIPCKVSTLAAKRRDGGGPAYRRVLARVEYPESSLRTWADALRAKTFTATAQEGVKRGARA
jgi:hypothetical protein